MMRVAWRTGAGWIVVAAAVWVIACGGGEVGEGDELGTVNAVEAALAIDDVRVAGVALGSLPPAGGLPRAIEAVTTGAPGETGTETRLAPAAVPEGLRPLARLATGDPLVVDMEVADAPKGSELTVVWGTAEGRAVWRQTQTVEEAPRLSFSAETDGWPGGIYQGAVLYGLEPVQRFAVQVGSLAPPTTVARATPAAGAGVVPGGGPAAARAGERSASASAAPSASAGASTPSPSAPAAAAPSPARPAAPAAQPAAPRSAPAAPAPTPAEPESDAVEAAPAEGEDPITAEGEDPITIVPATPPPPPPPPDEPVDDDPEDGDEEGDDDEPPAAGPRLGSV